MSIRDTTPDSSPSPAERISATIASFTQVFEHCEQQIRDSPCCEEDRRFLLTMLDGTIEPLTRLVALYHLADPAFDAENALVVRREFPEWHTAYAALTEAFSYSDSLARAVLDVDYAVLERLTKATADDLFAILAETHQDLMASLERLMTAVRVVDGPGVPDDISSLVDEEE